MDNIANTPQEQPTPFLLLETTLREHAQIIEERSRANQTVVHAYDIALGALTKQIEALTANPEVQESAHALQAQRDDDIATIESLHGRGLLNDDQFGEELGRIFASETYKPLVIFTMAKKIIGGEFQIVPVAETPVETGDESRVETAIPPIVDEQQPEEPPVLEQPIQPEQPGSVPSPEALKPKVLVNMTILQRVDGAVLQIGERGKIVPFSSARVSKDKRNYTDERIQGLRYLVENQGRPIKTTEMSEALGLDRETVRYVTNWLKTLTFRKSLIFRHNSVSGRGAGFIENKDMVLSIAEKVFSEKAIIDQPEGDDSTVRRTRRGNIRDIEPSPQNTLITDIEKGIIPLRESAVFLRVLHDNKDLLEALSIPQPPVEIVDSVYNASVQEDQKHNIVRNSTDARKLEEERQQVARQFRAVFSNNDLFYSFVTQIDEQNPLYPFMEYLFEFEEEHWDLVTQQVLRKTVSITTREASNGHQGTAPKDTIELIRLPNGRLFRRITPLDPEHRSETIFEEVIATGVNYGTDIDGETTSQASIPSPEIEELLKRTDQLQQAIVQRIAAVAPEQRGSLVPKWEIDLKREIGTLLDDLSAKGLIFEGLMKRSAIQSSFQSTKMFTQEAVDRMVKAKLISRQKASVKAKDMEFDFPTTLTMLMFNSNRDLFTSPRGTTAFKIIQESVASYLRKHPLPKTDK